MGFMLTSFSKANFLLETASLFWFNSVELPTLFRWIFFYIFQVQTFNTLYECFVFSDWLWINLRRSGSELEMSQQRGLCLGCSPMINYQCEDWEFSAQLTVIIAWLRSGVLATVLVLHLYVNWLQNQILKWPSQSVFLWEKLPYELAFDFTRIIFVCPLGTIVCCTPSCHAPWGWPLKIQQTDSNIYWKFCKRHKITH